MKIIAITLSLILPSVVLADDHRVQANPIAKNPEGVRADRVGMGVNANEYIDGTLISDTAAASYAKRGTPPSTRGFPKKNDPGARKCLRNPSPPQCREADIWRAIDRFCDVSPDGKKILRCN